MVCRCTIRAMFAVLGHFELLPSEYYKGLSVAQHKERAISLSMRLWHPAISHRTMQLHYVLLREICPRTLMNSTLPACYSSSSCCGNLSTVLLCKSDKMSFALADRLRWWCWWKWWSRRGPWKEWPKWSAWWTSLSWATERQRLLMSRQWAAR